MSEINPSTFCANCGTAMREGVSFCAACGHTVAHQMAPALVPAGPMYASVPAGAPKTKKRWGVVRILVIVFVILPLLFVAAVTVFLFVWSNLFPPACACVINPALELTNDYNAMVVIDKAAIVQQNSPDVTTSIKGLDARLLAHKNFDNQVANLTFYGMPSVQADKQKVLTTDNALEQVIVQEEANRSNITNYNAVLATEQPLDDAFAAAVKQLAGN